MASKSNVIATNHPNDRIMIGPPGMLSRASGPGQDRPVRPTLQLPALDLLLVPVVHTLRLVAGLGQLTNLPGRCAQRRRPTSTRARYPTNEASRGHASLEKTCRAAGGTPTLRATRTRTR